MKKNVLLNGCSIAAFLLLCILFPVTAGAQIISTIAGIGGSGSSVHSGDGGPATAAAFGWYLYTAVDHSGNVYVSDGTNQRVRKIDPSGTVTTVAGSGAVGYSGDGMAATGAKFYDPRGLAVDASGNLYIADYHNHCIRKVDAAGTISTIAGTGGSGYNGDGIAATTAELSLPGGVALDSMGNIYIADCFNNRVRKINASGIISTVAGGGTVSIITGGMTATSASLADLVSLAVTPGGDIYFSGGSNERIYKVTSSGLLYIFAGITASSYGGDGGPATAALFNGPNGLAVYNGELYIADEGNNRIRKVNSSGIVSTVAGTGVMGFSGDGGVATSAQVSRPGGMAIDATGNCYIGDNGNRRIRKFNVNTPSKAETELKTDVTVMVFPSPAKGDVTLRVTSSDAIGVNVTIADISGRKVKELTTVSNRDTPISLNVPAGVYLVTAIAGAETVTKQIVVE